MDDSPEAVFFYCVKCDEEYALPEDLEICPICHGKLEVIL